MKFTDLLPEDQKTLAAIRVLYPRRAGFVECVEAFQNALDSGVAPTKLVNSVAAYRFLVRVQNKRDWQHSPYVMSAKSFFTKKCWENEYDEMAYVLLKDSKADMITPAEQSRREAEAQAIKEREIRLQRELDERAANAPDIDPSKLLSFVQKRMKSVDNLT